MPEDPLHLCSFDLVTLVDGALSRLDDGQIVGRLVYERMSEVPARLYGIDLPSNYQGQGLKLSKHFRAA